MNSRIAITMIAILLVVSIVTSASYYQETQSYEALSERANLLQTNNTALSNGYSLTASALKIAEAKLANVTQQNYYLAYQLNNSQVAYDKLLANYSEKSYVYVYPSKNFPIPIWGINQTMSPNSYEEWDLLDTFDNHIMINTTEPARFLVFDLNSFVAYFSGDYSVPRVNITGTRFTYDVQLSEGCGVYVLFIRNLENSSNVIMPRITATYAPSTFLTATCAG